MYKDEILQEVWQVKSKIAEEYARDPDAYWAKLRQLGIEWKKRGAKSAPSPRKTVNRSRKLTVKKV